MPCKQSSTVSRYDGVCSCNLAKPTYPIRKLLTRAVEGFYDNCAAYNLRYITYRTSSDRNACLTNAMKDLILLACFLAANTVVLVTILSKLAMHLGGVILDIVDWIKANIVTNVGCCGRKVQKRLMLAIIDSESAQEKEKVAIPCTHRVVE